MTSFFWVFLQLARHNLTTRTISCNALEAARVCIDNLSLFRWGHLSRQECQTPQPSLNELMN